METIHEYTCTTVKLWFVILKNKKLKNKNQHDKKQSAKIAFWSDSVDWFDAEFN